LAENTACFADTGGCGLPESDKFTVFRAFRGLARSLQNSRHAAERFGRQSQGDL
jgi:hypothetical protein